MLYDPLHSRGSFPGGSVGTAETCNELCIVPDNKHMLRTPRGNTLTADRTVRRPTHVTFRLFILIKKIYMYGFHLERFRLNKTYPISIVPSSSYSYQ
jgi:hypothetical protein